MRQALDELGHGGGCPGRNMRSPESPAARLASPWRSSSARQAFVGLLASSAGPLSGVTLHQGQALAGTNLLHMHSVTLTIDGVSVSRSDSPDKTLICSNQHNLTNSRGQHASSKEPACKAPREVLQYLKTGSKLSAVSLISHRHCTAFPRAAESSTALTAE